MVSADWVVRKLALGHPSSVSRAIPGAEEKEVVKSRRLLQACINEVHEFKDTISDYWVGSTAE